jgi:hypothetical protein
MLTVMPCVGHVQLGKTTTIVLSNIVRDSIKTALLLYRLTYRYRRIY